MKKKVLALLLAVCLLAVCLPLSAGAETYQGLCGENVRYVIDTAAGTLTISGTGPMTDYNPNGGHNATEGPWLKYAKKIKTLVVEPGVTSIGDNAFGGMDYLTSATLPDTIETIGKYAFAECKKMKCNMPSKLQSIGFAAFKNCKALTGALVLPDTLTILNQGAFLGTGITSARVPGSVKEIRGSVFMYCYELKSVILEEGIESINVEVFKSSAIESLTIPASVTSIGNDMCYDCKNLKTVNIKGDITEIPEWCFSGCTSLQRIKLPNNLKKVSKFSFNGCRSLQRIDYPASVNYISYGVHDANKALKTITFATVGQDLYIAGDTLGDPTISVLYSENDSPVKAYAVKYGHDWQLIGSQPEDTWVPGQDVPSQPDKPDQPDIPVTPKFTDIKKGDFFYDAVQWAVEKGVTTGDTATTFGPNKSCDRGQIVTFLWRANGSPEPTSSRNPFVDVSSGDYYYKAVLWAKEKGITSGTDATHFSPSTPCNRGQAVTFLWRANGNPTGSGKSFSDVKSGQFYTDAVKWATGENITSGTSSTTFSPGQTCTRGQIVTFLYRDKT